MTTHFAIIVDNEVVTNVNYGDDPIFEKFIAIARSKPVFVEVPKPIEEGTKWDGENFHPSVG